jgi:YHS domain-containing protein
MKRLLVAFAVLATTLAARAEDEAGRRPAEPLVNDMTVDPVCQMNIHKSSAAFHETFGGEELWFCNKECHDTFLEKPARFVSANVAKRADAERAVERTAPEKEAETPPPAYDENAPIKNADWRNLMNSARQVREAAMTMMVLAVTLFSILVLGGLVLFTAGLAPNAVARSSVATRDHPIRSFLVGATVLFVGGLAMAVTKGILGVVIAPVLTAALLIGLAGVSEHLGRNLWHLAGKEGNRVGHIAAGWGTFALVAVVPLVGWFGFLPYYAAVGVGSFFSGMFGGNKARPEEPFGRV